MGVVSEGNQEGLVNSGFFQSGHFGQQFDLDLLDFRKMLLLAGQKVVDFLVKVAYFKFRLEVNPVVMLGPQAILGLLPILVHHDHSGLGWGPAGLPIHALIFTAICGV